MVVVISVVLAVVATVIVVWLMRRPGEAPDDEVDESLTRRALVLLKRITDEMKQSQAEASARADRVNALCSEGRLDEARRIYGELRADAAVSGTIGVGVGAGFCAAAHALALAMAKTGDLAGVATLTDHLAVLVQREDLSADTGVGVLVATSAIADAMLAAGRIDGAHNAIVVQARSLSLAPYLSELHAGPVGRLISAHLAAGRNAEARDAYQTFVVGSEIAIVLDDSLVAQLSDELN